MIDWGRAGTIFIGGDLPVRRVGFGGAWLTGPGTFGPPPDLEAARRSVRTALDAGVQLFDTADCYGPEISEELIAEALAPYPDGVVVSTKGGRRPLGNNQWQVNGRPEHLRRACEASLRRLRLERIDLYQLNAIDPDVPLAESLGALLELGDEGKVRHIGICNVNAEELAEASRIAPVASVQDRFDLTTRANEPVLRACEQAGLAFLPWFPPDNERRAEAGSALAEVAGRTGATPGQVALAWLLATSPVALPLPGTPDPACFEEDLEALALDLTDDEVAALDAMGSEAPD